MQSMPSNHMRAAAFQHYQQARQQQLYNAMELAQRNQRYMENHNPRPIISDQHYEESLPKEYVGYYVHDSPPAHPYRDVPTMSQVPTYNDLQHFRPSRPDFSRLRNAPRSPSPSSSMPYRDRSQSVRSSASAPSGPFVLDRTPNSSSSLRNIGPIIVDGSDGWEYHDYVPPNDTHSTSHASTMSSIHTSMDERYQYPNGIPTAPLPSHRSADPSSEYLYRPVQGYPVPEVPRAEDLFRNARLEQVQLSQVAPANGIKPPPSPSRSRMEVNQTVNGLGIQYDSSKTKANAVNPTNGSGQAPPRQVKQSQPIDTKVDQPNQGAETQLKSLPLLSPVREVRSPSPTALLKRRQGISDQPKPVILNGPLNLEIPPFSPERYEKRKQKEALMQAPNGKLTASPTKSIEPSQPISSPIKPQNLPLHVNGWQQTTRKGKKKGKGHSSQQSTDMNGEPIPADEADRKGG